LRPFSSVDFSGKETQSKDPTSPKYKDILSNFGLVSPKALQKVKRDIDQDSKRAELQNLAGIVYKDINGEIPNKLEVPSKADDDITYHCKLIQFDL
jgi:hypothetical protein